MIDSLRIQIADKAALCLQPAEQGSAFLRQLLPNKIELLKQLPAAPGIARKLMLVPHMPHQIFGVVISMGIAAEIGVIMAEHPQAVASPPHIAVIPCGCHRAGQLLVDHPEAEFGPVGTKRLGRRNIGGNIAPVESSAAKKAGVHSGNGIIDHRRDQHMIGRIHDRKHSFRKGSASRRIWGRFRRIRPAKHSIAQPNANCSAFRKIHKLSTGSRQFFHHIALFLRKLNFFHIKFLNIEYFSLIFLISRTILSL